MNKKYTTVDYDALTSTTGDPFVDTGGYALKEMMAAFPDDDILQLIMRATDIYVDNWGAKINPFFLNSTITQPKFKTKKDKIEKTQSYFEGLLNETSEFNIGHCRIMGRKANLFPANRKNSVLSGSGAFANFHHSFDAGMRLSKEALIRYHFLPLGSESLKDKICVISSNDPKIVETYARDCCAKTLRMVAQRISNEILKNKAKSTSTALFRYLDNVLIHYTLEHDNTSVTLYHFTNFGASPEIQIYTLPFQAFFFYRLTKSPLYMDSWNSFVASHYRSSEYKNATYKKEKGEITATLKKEEVVVKEDDFKYWRNTIYDKLLNGESIVPNVRKWSIDNPFDLELLKIYLINIRNMKKETIEKIDQIADFILSYNSETDMKKVLSTLNGVKSSFLLRRFILHVIADNYKQDNDLLVSVDDYVNYLFPDSSSWMETRDVLLIALYQKLHQMHMHVEIENADDDEDGFNDDDF